MLNSDDDILQNLCCEFESYCPCQKPIHCESAFSFAFAHILPMPDASGSRVSIGSGASGDRSEENTENPAITDILLATPAQQ